MVIVIICSLGYITELSLAIPIDDASHSSMPRRRLIGATQAQQVRVQGVSSENLCEVTDLAHLCISHREVLEALGLQLQFPGLLRHAQGQGQERWSNVRCLNIKLPVGCLHDPLSDLGKLQWCQVLLQHLEVFQDRRVVVDEGITLVPQSARAEQLVCLRMLLCLHQLVQAIPIISRLAQAFTRLCDIMMGAAEDDPR